MVFLYYKSKGRKKEVLVKMDLSGTLTYDLFVFMAADIKRMVRPFEIRRMVLIRKSVG